MDGWLLVFFCALPGHVTAARAALWQSRPFAVCVFVCRASCRVRECVCVCTSLALACCVQNTRPYNTLEPEKHFGIHHHKHTSIPREPIVRASRAVATRPAARADITSNRQIIIVKWLNQQQARYQLRSSSPGCSCPAHKTWLYVCIIITAREHANECVVCVSCRWACAAR